MSKFVLIIWKTMTFPTRIPVALPWSAAQWMPKTVGDLLKDECFLEFVDAWKRELHGSNRESEYLQFIMSESGLRSSEKLTIKLLRQILNRTADLVLTPPIRITHPAAAFELVTIVDGLSRMILKTLPKSAKASLETELTGISASVLIFAYQAVDQHFRNGSRITEN